MKGVGSDKAVSAESKESATEAVKTNSPVVRQDKEGPPTLPTPDKTAADDDERPEIQSISGRGRLSSQSSSKDDGPKPKKRKLRVANYECLDCGCEKARGLYTPKGEQHDGVKVYSNESGYKLYRENGHWWVSQHGPPPLELGNSEFTFYRMNNTSRSNRKGSKTPPCGKRMNTRKGLERPLPTLKLTYSEVVTYSVPTKPIQPPKLPTAAAVDMGETAVTQVQFNLLAADARMKQAMGNKQLQHIIKCIDCSYHPNQARSRLEYFLNTDNDFADLIDHMLKTIDPKEAIDVE